MPLPDPRKGVDIGFRIYPALEDASTIGEPEKVIWSSIEHLCVQDVADRILHDVHGVTRSLARATIIKNISLYIRHAHDFYQAAQSAEPDTSPLLYYYSFLNLAKARCEIKTPRFHRVQSSYHHGVTWKPNPNFCVNMYSEKVNISTRGVWHELLDSRTNQSLVIPNPLPLSIKKLFSYCPEISIEYSRTYGGEPNLVNLYNPQLLMDDDFNNYWLKFSVSPDELAEVGMTKPRFLQYINSVGNPFHQVKSSDTSLITYEHITPRSTGTMDAEDMFQRQATDLNIFTALDSGEILHCIPLQNNLSIRLPQIVVLYTLLFWLGSLVRYDPHSLATLHDSEFWILIDGFMNQSRIWLLELFEWDFYRTETALTTSR